MKKHLIIIPLFLTSFLSAFAQWSLVNFVPEGKVIMVDDSIGYRDRYNYLSPSSGWRSYLYKTTDDWATEVPLRSLSNDYLQILKCYDELNCVYSFTNGLGGISRFRYTRTGFSSDQQIGSSARINTFHTAFFSDSTGFLTGVKYDPNGRIYKLTGTSIIEVYDPDSLQLADCNIAFPLVNKGFVALKNNSNNHYLIETTDGGLTWNFNISNSTHHYTSIYFVDSLRGYLTTDIGNIFYTSNGGINWNFLSQPTTNRINSIKFKNDTMGVIVGSAGTIMRTYDAGVSWLSEVSNSTRNLEEIQFLPNNIEYVRSSIYLYKHTHTLVGINNLNKSKNSIKFFPNPVNSFLNIEFSNQVSFQESIIFNSQGKLLIKSRSERINVNHLPIGIYIVQVRTNEGIFQKKVIKQ